MATKNTKAAQSKEKTASALQTIDRLLEKLGTTKDRFHELEEAVHHLTAARAIVAPKIRRPLTAQQRISDARDEIARLARWPQGPKMVYTRHALNVELLLAVRPLIEQGYGKPTKPLAPALASTSGLTLSEAQHVVDQMVRAGTLPYPAQDD